MTLPNSWRGNAEACSGVPLNARVHSYDVTSCSSCGPHFIGAVKCVHDQRFGHLLEVKASCTISGHQQLQFISTVLAFELGLVFFSRHESVSVSECRWEDSGRYSWLLCSQWTSKAIAAPNKARGLSSVQSQRKSLALSPFQVGQNMRRLSRELGEVSETYRSDGRHQIHRRSFLQPDCQVMSSLSLARFRTPSLRPLATSFGAVERVTSALQ